MNLGGGALANKGEACLAPTCGGCMDKETIARHLGVDSGQIVSARPEPGEEGLRVLVDYGIGGIKVFHVPPSPEPAKASSPNPEPAKASSPNPEPAEASSPNQEPAKASSPNPEPAEA